MSLNLVFCYQWVVGSGDTCWIPLMQGYRALCMKKKKQQRASLTMLRMFPTQTRLPPYGG